VTTHRPSNEIHKEISLENPWVDAIIPTFPTFFAFETRTQLTTIGVRARESSAAPWWTFGRCVIRILRQPGIDEVLVRETYPVAWAAAQTKTLFFSLSLDDGKLPVDPVPAGLPREDVSVSPASRRMYRALYRIALKEGLNKHCIGKDYRNLAAEAGYGPPGKPDYGRAYDEIELAVQEGILSILHRGNPRSKSRRSETAVFCLRGACELMADAEADGRQGREYKKRMASVNAASSSNGTQLNGTNGSSVGLSSTVCDPVNRSNADNGEVDPGFATEAVGAELLVPRRPPSLLTKPVAAATPIAVGNDEGPQILQASSATSADEARQPLGSSSDPPKPTRPPKVVTAATSSELPATSPRGAGGNSEASNSLTPEQDVVLKTKLGSVVVSATDVREVLDRTYRIALKYDLSPRRPWANAKCVYALIEMLGTKEAVIQRYIDAVAAGVDKFELQSLHWFADWVSAEIKAGREDSWHDHVKASGRRPRVPAYDDSWHRRDVSRQV
jgi:hypothetical protein